MKYDGEAFKKIIENTGVPIRHKEYSDAIHGFVEIYFSGRMKNNFWLGKSLIKAPEKMADNFIEEVKCFIDKICSDR